MSNQDSPREDERIKYMEIRALIARKAAEIRIAVATLAELAQAKADASSELHERVVRYELALRQIALGAECDHDGFTYGEIAAIAYAAFSPPSGETISPWRRKDGEYFCINCGCRQGIGHHPTCIEAL